MTALAPHLAAFLREHLRGSAARAPTPARRTPTASSSWSALRRAGWTENPAAGYRTARRPACAGLPEHIESDRGNSARTRNAQLAAVNAFFRFLEYRLPACLDQSSRIHAIPMKKTDETLVGYLTRDELQALLDAPDPRTRSACAIGRCCISPSPRGYACPNWSIFDWTRSIDRRAPASTCWERDGANACCRYGRRPPPL